MGEYYLEDLDCKYCLYKGRKLYGQEYTCELETCPYEDMKLAAVTAERIKNSTSEAFTL